MKPRRPRLRPFTTLALTLGLTLAGAACDKGGDATKEPGDRKNGSKVEGEATTKLDGGKDYVYPSEGFVLTATTKIKFGISSKQGSGEAEVSARSLIEATPANDKLEVHGKVLELIGYTGSGQLDPEFMKKQAAEAGQADFDLLAELGKAEGWMVIDAKGELDKAATEALPENKTEDESVDFGLFNLPDLPRVDLVEGEKITLPTQEVERQTLVGMVPVEVDETWTLRKIDANRIAEIDVSSETSGATQITGGQGSANVSMFEESSYTLLYNLETRLPVSITGYSQSEMQLDIEGQSETITIEQNSEVSGTYEPGVAGPAAAPPAAEAPAEAPAAPAVSAPAPEGK